MTLDASITVEFIRMSLGASIAVELNRTPIISKAVAQQVELIVSIIVKPNTISKVNTTAKLRVPLVVSITVEQKFMALMVSFTIYMAELAIMIKVLNIDVLSTLKATYIRNIAYYNCTVSHLYCVTLHVLFLIIGRFKDFALLLNIPEN